MTTATAAHPLRTSIQDRTAKLGVVGLGYVGLPLAMLYSRAGFPVLGFDIDASKIATLNAGRSYIQRILPQEIQELRDNGFSATADYSRIGEVDAVMLCVPTPLDEHQGPDMSYIDVYKRQAQHSAGDYGMGAGLRQLRLERGRVAGQAGIRPLLSQEPFLPARCADSLQDREDRIIWSRGSLVANKSAGMGEMLNLSRNGNRARRTRHPRKQILEQSVDVEANFCRSDVNDVAQRRRSR